MNCEWNICRKKKTFYGGLPSFLLSAITSSYFCSNQDFTEFTTFKHILAQKDNQRKIKKNEMFWEWEVNKKTPFQNKSFFFSFSSHFFLSFFLSFLLSLFLSFFLPFFLSFFKKTKLFLITPQRRIKAINDNVKSLISVICTWMYFFVVNVGLANLSTF